jgi:hypothetical protein
VQGLAARMRSARNPLLAAEDAERERSSLAPTAGKTRTSGDLEGFEEKVDLEPAAPRISRSRGSGASPARSSWGAPTTCSRHRPPPGRRSTGASPACEPSRLQLDSSFPGRGGRASPGARSTTSPTDPREDDTRARCSISTSGRPSSPVPAGLLLRNLDLKVGQQIVNWAHRRDLPRRRRAEPPRQP